LIITRPVQALDVAANMNNAQKLGNAYILTNYILKAAAIEKI